MQELKPITNKISGAQKLRTQQKFLKWDKVIQKRYLEGTEKQVAYAVNLLKDPTIYTYAFFKDPRHPDKPMELFPYQDVVINDPSKRVVCAWANQTGKSTTAELMAIHFALLNPGKTVLITSKNLEQSKDRIRNIRGYLASSPLDYKFQIGESDNKTEIYFRHFDENGKELRQSRIVAVPATEAALSYSVDLAIPDEIAFYENGRDFYFRILNPRTYFTKGKIFVPSNTNGAQGIMWDLWNDDDFSRYNFDFLTCPINTKEEFEKLRRKLTKSEFDSTVLSAFTSPRGGFISEQERRAMQEERPNELPIILTEPIYIFFDFGKAYDRTVRSIGMPVGYGDEIGVKVLEIFEYEQGTPYNKIVNDLKELIGYTGPENVVSVGWDNTGVGKGIEDFITNIQLLGIPCEPVEFSLKNKSRIYTVLKLLIERNLKGMNGIKMPYTDNGDQQWSRLRFKKSERGYLQVHHEDENDRDDIPDSIAGLCSLIVQPNVVPVSVKML